MASSLRDPFGGYRAPGAVKSSPRRVVAAATNLVNHYARMLSSLALAAAAAPAHLPGVLHSLEAPLQDYGYLAIAGFVFLEDFGVPVPGETILVVGAVYAGIGRLSVVLVALLGLVAATLGDNVGFAIGHFGGRPLVVRYGRYILLTPQRLDRATAFFERHGGKIVMLARFIEGLRQANGIIAGISGMHWAKFLVFNAIGAALWVAVWTSVGFLGQPHHVDLQRREPLQHLPGDRRGRARGRPHRAARLAAANRRRERGRVIRPKRTKAVRSAGAVLRFGDSAALSCVVAV
jgi:membrane protein DedA with SNARE-associated domain